MGLSDNRHTQLDMLALAEAKSPSQTSETPRLHGSLSHAWPPKSDNANKKRARSPEDVLDATTVTGKAKSNTFRPATTGSLKLRATWGSPWVRYEKIYRVELGGPVEVAVRKVPPVELVHVRAFPKPDAETTLHIFRHTQHSNIVAALDAFKTKNGLYIAFEHLPVSLEWIIKSPAYPDERQLAAILGQMAWLTSQQKAMNTDLSVAQISS
ncbi:MAG: hypothetical protein M1812_005803 [Candelaria pacifica]|nr:MAG: hypothetical protein M1812_005803 [Candelaria pacifica]